MDTAEIQNKIISAVHLFLANDRDLLTLGVNEQSVTHRIAVYLEPIFKGYHVDCEYNKSGNDPKEIPLTQRITDAWNNCKCGGCTKERNVSRMHIPIRPDIIIHKERGLISKGNIVAIEVKKAQICEFDKAKLEALTDGSYKYQYEHGVFIYFPNSIPEFRWFPKEKKDLF